MIPGVLIPGAEEACLETRSAPMCRLPLDEDQFPLQNELKFKCLISSYFPEKQSLETLS